MDNDRFTALLRRAISRRENREALPEIFGDLKEAIRILEEEMWVDAENAAISERHAKQALAGVDPVLLNFPR